MCIYIPLVNAGQFFQKGVKIDETRKILILPGKEPVPVMRRPVWSFMEREVADDQLCWTAMNPGYQGEGLRLIDGTYFDYLVNDVLSTDFKFKEQQLTSIIMSSHITPGAITVVKST